MVGMLMARRMRSGTGLGPGICRKWLPTGWKSRVSMLRPLQFRNENAMNDRHLQDSLYAATASLFRKPHMLNRAAATDTSELLKQRLGAETEGEILFDD